MPQHERSGYARRSLLKANLNFLDASKTRILLSEEKIDLDFAEREG